MKKQLLKFALIALVVMLSSISKGQSKNSDFIFLNAEQLRNLGIDLSERGLFYLNCHRVLGRQNLRGVPCLEISLEDSLLLKIWHSADFVELLFREKKITNHNFFPIVITTPQGCLLAGRENIDRRKIPIAVSLSEANLSANEDTIIFWFTLTDRLISALPEYWRTDLRWRNYLRVPYIDHSRASDADTVWQHPYGLVTLEILPEFPGGVDAMRQFLINNIRFPEEARNAGIQGTVFVTFVVERNGRISNVGLLRGIGGGADEEAIRVVSMMPRWSPGTQDGRPVRVQFTMPIRFSQPPATRNRNVIYHWERQR